MGKWTRGPAALLAVVAWVGAGCDSDIFDVEVNLETRVYRLDFGSLDGTIPDVACDPSAASVCDVSRVVGIDARAAAGIPATVDLSAGCDPTAARCYAQAETRTTATIDVFSDDDFTNKVARRTVSMVRVADLAYTVPVNSLTMDVPKIDVFVGPEGTTRETDPNVVPVGSTAPIPAGTTVDSEQHLAIGDDSPARGFIEESIRARRPFVFGVVLAPRVLSGAPIPAGELEVAVSPRLLIGFPR